MMKHFVFLCAASAAGCVAQREKWIIEVPRTRTESQQFDAEFCSTFNLTDLENEGALGGKLLGKGAQGTVYLSKADPQWVVKLVNPDYTPKPKVDRHITTSISADDQQIVWSKITITDQHPLIQEYARVSTLETQLRAKGADQTNLATRMILAVVCGSGNESGKCEVALLSPFLGTTVYDWSRIQEKVETTRVEVITAARRSASRGSV